MFNTVETRFRHRLDHSRNSMEQLDDELECECTFSPPIPLGTDREECQAVNIYTVHFFVVTGTTILRMEDALGNFTVDNLLDRLLG
jgi:hypothetical protein